MEPLKVSASVNVFDVDRIPVRLLLWDDSERRAGSLIFGESSVFSLHGELRDLRRLLQNCLHAVEAEEAKARGAAWLNGASPRV